VDWCDVRCAGKSCIDGESLVEGRCKLAAGRSRHGVRAEPVLSRLILWAAGRSARRSTWNARVGI
jgi:hypothetical protein